MDTVGKLLQAVMDGEETVAAESAQKIVDGGIDLQEPIAKLTETMRVLGKQFEDFEIFLPEMIMAADAMTAVMRIFEPVLLASGKAEKKGVIVLGAAPGDMHEIGKNIVKTVLTTAGFRVVDLGKNVQVMDFINKAEEVNADIIGISTLMTTTMPGASDVLKLLSDKGLRDKYKVIVGGAPTNGEWANRIGADGWSGSAPDAVLLANRLLEVS